MHAAGGGRLQPGPGVLNQQGWRRPLSASAFAIRLGFCAIHTWFTRFVVWRMPTRERGRPARTFARHSRGRLRRWDGTATGPCPSFGLASAVHAGWVAACRLRWADAPPPPARNKVAGETPAFPGGASPLSTPPYGGVILEVCKRPLARHSVGRLRRWDGTVAGPCLSFELANAVHAGWLAAGNVALTLHLLQREIRLRARRPRSRVGRSPRSRVGGQRGAP